jgi:hypothetical protein
MAAYKAGGQHIVDMGGLHFVVMHRTLGDDGGVTIEVFGDVEGKSVQVLRFDMFDKAPHYHHAPFGKNINTPLDPREVGDTAKWAMTQIRSNIPEMLKTAGYETLAGSVDANAFATEWTKVSEAVDAAKAAA